MLATALHLRPRDTEEITIRECEALSIYWAHSPPPHISLARLAAAQTTWKPKGKPTPFKESAPEEIAAFAAAVGLRRA